MSPRQPRGNSVMVAIIVRFNRIFNWNLLPIPQKSIYRVRKMSWFFMKPKCERGFDKAHKRVKGTLTWKQANYLSNREGWIKPFQLEEQFVFLSSNASIAWLHSN